MILKTLDEYLKFIQGNSNINSTSSEYKDIVRNLDYFSKIQNIPVKSTLQYLKSTKEDVKILDENYDKFIKLGNYGFDQVEQVYSLVDDIINDTKKAHNWLSTYRDFLIQTQSFNTHEDLVVLGKAILGRAVELTPIKTGMLRKSGILIDMKDSITIAFTAPYATYVHEDLNKRHEVGGAKFLERAVQEFFPDTTVWTEQLGTSEIAVTISLNPTKITYKHYGTKE